MFFANNDWVVHSSVLPQNFGLLRVDFETNSVGCFVRRSAFCRASICMLGRRPKL